MSHYLTPETRDRLMRLAIYLDSLPKNYKEFDMSDYFSGKKDDALGKLEKKYALYNGGVAKCGTNACAVGHGPSAGIPVPRDLIKKEYSYTRGDCWEIDWSTYSDLFTDRVAGLFEWMFGSDWSAVDNHHYGAAARIKYILMGREIPDDEDYKVYPRVEHVRLYDEFRKRKYVAPKG